MKKSLIVYFSRSGQNYVSGRIENLSQGNTEFLAKMIHKKVNGDLFKIETVKAYPEDYEECTKKAKEELQKMELPKIIDYVYNLSDYDVVFLGYPNWWGTIPLAVFTFLKEHDLSGKIIIPFCTHEGSGLGNSVRDIKKQATASTIVHEIAIYGNQVYDSEEVIDQWLKQLEDII